MSKSQRIKARRQWVDTIVAEYLTLDRACDAAMAAGSMDPNGPLFDAIWRSWEKMLDRIDVDGWLNWYIQENHCGEKGMSAAGPGQKLRPVKTSLDLARIIEASS
jgi:hypothetical protein